MPLREVELPCSLCNGSVVVNMAVPPGVVNGEGVSLVIVEHQSEAICPHCLAVVRPVIVGAPSLNVMLAPVPVAKQQSKIIVPS